MALYEAGHLGQGKEADFYYGTNDTKYRWISREDWTFETSFAVDDAIMSWRRILLRFEGLDTAADIELNEELIGSTSNMFVEYTFDVTELVRSSLSLRLRVKFRNMADYAKKKHDEYPYLVPDDSIPILNGEKYRNYVRKEQCSFAWDWGPCFLPVGLWKPVYLVGYRDTVTIDSALTHVTRDGDSWKIHVLVNVSSDVENSIKTLKIRLLGFKNTKQFIIYEKEAECAVELIIPSSDVELWWPHGYGKQPLYDLNIEVEGHDTVTRRIGFRTARLCQPLDSDKNGSAFFFVVNGKPIFAKGSNFIPVDVFESRVDHKRIRKLLEDAVDANMNQLRVWGGGIYQQDAFYDICDELGIMVWQEFMFACAMYPASSEFLASVHAEVECQVHRLVHHPSIVLWSGNNENEEVLLGQWFDCLKKNPYLYTVDYYKLYYETIYPLIQKLDPTRDYIGSSPSNGLISNDPLTLRFKVENPRKWADTHFYNYRDNGLDETTYPLCRFASEYGFQAFPWFSTMKQFTPPETWKPLSGFMIQRNHHINGQPELIQQIEMHFDIRFRDECTPLEFERFCYLTQVIQALIYKSQTEFYRRLMRSDFYCMGALYWQFNDIWPAPTWSGIESTGKWKLLMNYAKDFFEPLLLSLAYDFKSGKVSVWLLNDSPETVLSGIVHIELWNYAEGRMVDSWTADELITVKSNEAKEVKVFEKLPQYQHCILRVSSDKATGNQLFLSNFKGLKLPTPNIVTSFCSMKSAKEFQFIVKSSTFALFVACETEISGRFHPNGFTLFPNEPQTVSFRSFESTLSEEKAKELLNCINIKSIS